MNPETAPMTFEAIVAVLPDAPGCTFRFDAAPCRHRAEWFVRKRPCCHQEGVDFLCDTCHVRINWLLDIGVEFECVGCGARSDSFTALCPVAAPL